MSMINIGSVIESSSSQIIIKISDVGVFESNKEQIKIGKYLSVQEGNHNYILSVIQNIKITEDAVGNKYLLALQPIGSYHFNEEDKLMFKQGGVNLPSPTEPVFITDENIIEGIFSANTNFDFHIGNLVNNDAVSYYSDGDKFFSKHIAVVGSTGSGKSCAVAKLLQEALSIQDATNKNKDRQKNTHIIVFDIHSEYQSAFTLKEDEQFNLNCLDVEKMCIPYWLMNSEELESLFIESNELNSHNQISQFKRAVILSKEKHNPGKRITYDMPVYFDITEVYNFIFNLNCEVIGRADGENKPKLADGILVTDYSIYLDKKCDFVTTSQSKADKASNGAFNGEFNRFLTRLETKMADSRLDFIMDSEKHIGKLYKSEDFETILKQFIGYLNKSNVTIIDFSGVPFEVLSISVSLIARLVFDFAFHYSKLCHKEGDTSDIPFMIVCEEAHNYVPQHGGAEYKASKKSIERIAKEGRKYGLSLMVVSQRPSEVSDTIFSQCNNFISLRLTNVNDQGYIKTLLPDNSNSLVDTLPTLAAGEALIVGDAVPIPAIVRLDMPNPQPKSDSVKFYNEWNKDWVDAAFEETINRWRNE